MPWSRKWQPTSILAWKILWTEEPDRLQSMGISKSWTWLSDWLLLSLFKSSPLEKEINTGNKGRLCFTATLLPSSWKNLPLLRWQIHLWCVCMCERERENTHEGLQSHPRRKLEVYLWFAQGLFPTPIPAPPRQGSERAEMGLLNPLICSSSQLSRQLVPPLYRAGTQGGRYLRSREFCKVMDSVRPAFLGAILDNGWQ